LNRALTRAGIFSGHKSSILEQSGRTSESLSSSSPPSNRTLRRQIPNALSALRFALAAGWIEMAARNHQGRIAFIAIALVAAASDFIDGRVARRLGATTSSGRWMDGIADVSFVLAAIFSSAAAGAIPYYIPILIAISFSQYAIDSILISRPAAAAPIKSRLGHWGGIINYALVIALAVAPGSSDSATSASAVFVDELIRVSAPLLALFYIAAIIERALTYRHR
jgi:cardiolipin synthase (CMP-forming)